MSKKTKLYRRRHRRKNRAILKYGRKAGPIHKALFGRTGQSRERKNPSKKRFIFRVTIMFDVPNSIRILEVKKR